MKVVLGAGGVLHNKRTPENNSMEEKISICIASELPRGRTVKACQLHSNKSIYYLMNIFRA